MSSCCFARRMSYVSSDMRFHGNSDIVSRYVRTTLRGICGTWVTKRRRQLHETTHTQCFHGRVFLATPLRTYCYSWGKNRPTELLRCTADYDSYRLLNLRWRYLQYAAAGQLWVVATKLWQRYPCVLCVRFKKKGQPSCFAVPQTIC